GRVRSRLSSRPCLEDPRRSGLELPAAGGTSPRAKRGSDPPLAERALVRHQKSAPGRGARSSSSKKADKPATASRTALVAARRDSGSAIQLQLGHALGGRRDHLL